jgi:hypothetical protein
MKTASVLFRSTQVHLATKTEIARCGKLVPDDVVVQGLDGSVDGLLAGLAKSRQLADHGVVVHAAVVW